MLSPAGGHWCWIQIIPGISTEENRYPVWEFILPKPPREDRDRM